MNPNPEQHLQRFRLPAPSPGLRARVLAAAREEWQRPAPVSAGWALRRPLLAVAAALVLLVAGKWTNQHLVSPVAQAPAWKTVVFAGRTTSRFVMPGGGFIDPRAATAVLRMRHDQMRRLLNKFPPPATAPGPNGQTRQFRQNPPAPASCC